MNVKQLIAKLKKLPQDAEVYTASDEEGNSYNQTYYDPTVFYKYYETGDIVGYEDLDEDQDYEEVVVI